MNEQALRARARQAGIAVDWIDATGRPQRVRTESLRRLLESLHDADDGPDLPPLVTARLNTPTILANLSLDADIPAELALEDGNVRRLTLRSGKGASVPAVAQPGYHRLRFADREITLAVAPARCLTLDDIGAGRRMWGVAAQIYGLRRSGDGGIGDAGAVRDLAEAAARRGADAVALSPLHSLFPADPSRYSPYSPSSRLFLNPLYADPSATFAADRIAACTPSGRQALEGAPSIDWAAAAAAKFAVLRCLFDDFANRDLAARSVLAADFERFVREGGEALREHALFDALHDERPGNWTEWPAGWRQPRDAAAVRYHLFLQWLTARSFAAAQTAARAAGMRIGLIGDLAIGMDRSGSHAWARQSDLLLGLAIGAPPDAFNPRGQDWGLTGFSPRALVAQGFGPFLATLRAALSHAGGVRIDHVMGLMRLWWVPDGMPPDRGAYVRYDHRLTVGAFTSEAARASALAIGEDLGTVDPWIRRYLAGQHVLGTEMAWFAREPDGSPLRPPHWRRACLATVGTHDIPPAVGFVSGDHVIVRARLGLLDDPEAERKAWELRLSSWLDALVAERLLPPDSLDHRPGAAEFAQAMYSYLALTPARLVGVSLADAVGDRRAQNIPGTLDEYPNWRVPLCDGEGRAVLLEDLPDSELVRSVVGAATRLTAVGERT